MLIHEFFMLEENKPSKSQKKREAEKLQEIGVELVALPLKKLDTIPLPENLRQAILDAKKIKGYGAIRRQAQLIGKLMLRADNQAIIEAYEALDAEAEGKTALFHEIELWRDRLMLGEASLQDFLLAFPKTDSEALEALDELIKKASHEKDFHTKTGAAKALFRFLRSIM